MTRIGESVEITLKVAGMKHKFVFLGFGLIFSCYAEVWGADWRPYAGNDEGFFYYDATSITRTSEGTVRVLRKGVLTEKAVIHAVEKLGEKYTTLSYVIDLEEVRCADKRIRFLSSAFYSEDGKVLSSFDYQAPDWIYLGPESMREALYEILCKQP